MRHLPRRLTPIALASLLALSACASPTPDAEFDDPGTSASDTTATQPADDAAGADEQADGTEETADAPAAKDPSAYTVRYADSDKTVITLDRAQVEQLTGTDLAAGTADAQAVLAEPGTWSGADTKEHADVIVDAATRESDRIDRVLTQQADGRDVELRLFVKHHQDAHVAHFGEDDDD
ncbi:hypothetical protein ACFQ8E_19245 [Isoptericola sp. NPDC056573]|uniref:hypothetical protein n=1 Tax=Isoptericola sp. NPDC056573 TaxID=3345868 RepID=UPI0036C176E8